MIPLRSSNSQMNLKNKNNCSLFRGRNIHKID